MEIAQVVAPDGRRWTVRRRFRWPSLRVMGPDERHDIIAESGLSLGPVGFFILVVAIVFFFVLPFFVFIIEIVVALAAVLFLRGTWIIEATTDGPPPQRKARKVRGPFRARQALEEITSELRAGSPAAPSDGEAV